MRKLVNLLVCVLASLSCAVGQAQAPAAELRQASENFVKALELGSDWPAMIENAAASGAENVRSGALEAINDNPTMTAAQREKARRIVPQLAAEMASEITAFQKSIDFPRLVREMMEASYQKYYDAQEIQSMADFYASPAVRKKRAVEAEIAAEHQRTGEDAGALRQRHEAKFTPQEKQVLADYAASPTAKKQRSVDDQVNAAIFTFLYQRVMSEVGKITERYAKILADRIKREQ